MNAVISPTFSAELLKKLRKKRRWRSVVEHGIVLLDKPAQAPPVLVHTEMAKAFIELRQYDLARRHLVDAAALRPSHASVLRRFGELEFAEGNFEAAVKHWQALKAKKKAKSVGSVLLLKLARAHRFLGQLDAATKIAREGCSLYPKSLKLRTELVRITSMTNDAPAPPDARPRRTSADRAHPYRDLDPACYWKETVPSRNCLEIDNWYRRKFSINGLSISSAGSCFAQHIGRALRENGFEYVDVEPAPNFLLPESHHDYGFGIYSARFGNIYTSRQLLQLLQRSLGLFEPEDAIWQKDDGFVDALRPTIEPEPADRRDDIVDSRTRHLAAVERMFRLSNVFIFTMGLTETWVSTIDGTAYPVAPGVSGGKYDPARYSFKNLSHADVYGDMQEFVELARSINPSLKIILTVSPVPLMATATEDNVIVASSYSKSVLRAVAGQLKAEHDFIDYFPSFEIVGSHTMRGQFFNPDGRTVSQYGVAHVMKQFFAEHVPPAIDIDERPRSVDPDDVVCDEELLNEFGP